jgi:hypothetical protein
MVDSVPVVWIYNAYVRARYPTTVLSRSGNAGMRPRTLSADYVEFDCQDSSGTGDFDDLNIRIRINDDQVA